jgi:catechol 2,3-dioxygenase-like lactoylglutathione lyase family enzyme
MKKEAKRVDALLKIDSVMFFVSDLEEAAEFYANVLGLRRVWTDESRKMIGFDFPETV